MIKSKKQVPLVLLLIVMQLTSGCAAVTALKQPSKKNLNVLTPGTARENVITYLGAPISSEKNNGDTVEIYKFRQGYSGGNKATRATTHIILDIFTLFIWELIGWPIEAVVNGQDMTIKVTYDSENRLKDVAFLEGQP
ncbi:MAG: hypothetical protein EXS63_05420 [Candidatus Omnitrophica bacterium]|nr:hypothetical protein [Candidatus Omnitrophota bacterium]